MPSLLDRSRRPRNSPTRLSAEVETEICERRRRHPRWGARRISHELAARGLESAPSRATVHRVLSRNGLVRPQEQQHPRKYSPWQREAPMHLWQMDLVGRRQLLGSSAAAGDTAENSSDIPRSVRRPARTTVSVEHADNQSASRTRWPRHPAPPVALEDLRKAGAAKAEGAPPLSQAQVDRIVAILRREGSQASAHRGRGAPHRTTGGRGSGTRRHGVRSRSSRVRAHPVPQREPAGLVLPDATETDYWTGMAPAMLVIALDFGTGVIARTRPQSMEWTTTTGDRLGAVHLRPALRRHPRARDPVEQAFAV